MRPTTFVILVILAAACGKKADAPTSGSAASGGSAAGSGSAAAAGSAATGSAAASSGSAAVGSGSAATRTTCADGNAAACVVEARAIAPTGAFRAKLSKEEADRKVEATAKLAARACTLGAGEGCALLARYGNFAESEQHLERACELGHVPSCGSIGRGLADGGKPADHKRSAELLEKACDAAAFDWKALTSHPGAFCHVLYELYKDAIKDKDKAAKALERACAQGDKRDCACKTDADCGKVPDDMAGTYDCNERICDLTGGG